MNEEKIWENLFPDQIAAADHIGNHARLLAGPGTGKTLTITRRALALVIKHDVSPEDILILTFTRVAAYQLKEKIYKVLEPLKKGFPKISTLHSFALRQLLKNSDRITMLPKPLRIADDWEERNIIQENLKNGLKDHLPTIMPEIRFNIKKIQTLFNQLSSDWETMEYDKEETDRNCKDSKFLGAWRQHREIFGYTLRSELIYQLKKALEKDPDFELESNFKHVMVDEFQDLNPCDLSLIEEFKNRGAEIYAVGDDDQSIYGFRYADPKGIRSFTEKYIAINLDLEICHRCDKNILKLSEEIANLDPHRLPKKTRNRDDAGEGAVSLLKFDNQYKEADWISGMCNKILEVKSDRSILILLRSDNKGVMSSVLKQALISRKVPVYLETEDDILDNNDARIILSFLKLINNRNDSLAWYTIFMCEDGIGEATLIKLIDEAKRKGVILSNIVTSDLKNIDKKLCDKFNSINAFLDGLDQSVNIEMQIDYLLNILSVPESKLKIKEKFLLIIKETGSENTSQLIDNISLSMNLPEQEIKEGMVNIITMHKAKGLTADVVFIVGAEKQFLPGRNTGAKLDDERRLFYVSLTRAKNYLIITYCKERIDSQRHIGSDSGNSARELTPFLLDTDLKTETVD